ncbi:hypothetical protein EV421DRAFT_1999932 [Armillaria borealis]|uniref:HNH nuclease domain-containing protein n=1 Tax=Armillaria borealis TaxID=47425 RepID=A0AA39MW45_9AGAR|nr:hypothetical protein EV421DRAFT_1999932 [Armillaria borealis]
MPERLPPNPFDLLSDEHAAYESCLNLELLAVAGASLLKSDISSCDDNAEFLAGLSYLYVMGVIRTFRNPKGAIPTPQSDHSPGSSHDNVEALLSQPTADAKKLALARDNHRSAGERRRNTILAHIFGQSTTDNIVVGGLTDAAQRKLAWAASAADVVERFAEVSIVNELNQNSIHKPENTFTISPEFHGPFDELQFSLHPVGAYGLPDRVTLKDATGGKIPLPSRRYFQLHDAYAKIAHLSGQGEVVDQLFQDLGDVQVLADDGGSHYLLSLALLSRSGAHCLEQVFDNWLCPDSI